VLSFFLETIKRDQHWYFWRLDQSSTGYFQKFDKNQVNGCLSTRETDFTKFHKTKFWFYDLLLLDILDRKKRIGFPHFSSMFKKGNPVVIFKFLDEKPFIEDIQVILKCPKMLFIKAILTWHKPLK
jgi:lycopene beta-cyclase